MPPTSSKSVAELTRLIDVSDEIRRALRLLDRPIDQLDDWFVHLIVYNLDADTRKDWEKSLESRFTVTHQRLVGQNKRPTHLLNRTIPLQHIILRSRHHPRTQGISVSLVRPRIISLTARRTKKWQWRKN